MCMPQRKVSLSFPAQLIHKSQTIVKNYKFVSQRAPFNAAGALLALVVTEFAMFMIWPQAPY